MIIPTDEQMNIAMCEWMGWKFEEAPVQDPSPSCWRTPDGYYPVFTEDLPNYTSDDSPRRLLNDAEAKLTDDQFADYYQNLVWGNQTLGSRGISATARQRVIAILQVVKPDTFK